jgi:integrase-like protein
MSTTTPISPLRRRMIEDMTVRGFGEKTQSNYIRHVKNFTIFLGRSPDLAEGEDLRAFQVRQREQGVQPPTMNGAVAALNFRAVPTAAIPDKRNQPAGRAGVTLFRSTSESLLPTARIRVEDGKVVACAGDGGRRAVARVEVAEY